MMLLFPRIRLQSAAKVSIHLVMENIQYIKDIIIYFTINILIPAVQTGFPIFSSENNNLGLMVQTRQDASF